MLFPVDIEERYTQLALENNTLKRTKKNNNSDYNKRTTKLYSRAGIQTDTRPNMAPNSTSIAQGPRKTQIGSLG